MKSYGSLGIWLSLVFGSLLLALVAEIYYLLWWKKRINNGETKDDYITSTWELFYMSCWKKPSSLSSTTLNTQTSQDQDTQNPSKDLLLKPFGEEDIESELKRLHNLSGPTRFLCTIKEETREDLESEDGRSRDGRSKTDSRSRSLSDLMFKVESPSMTPLPSSPFFTPPRTPKTNHNNHGFNPLYESSTDTELNKIRSSPPPKFKFLKDAEDKLYRRILMEEAEKRLRKAGRVVQDDKIKVSPPNSPMVKDERDGSFITIVVDNNKDKELHHHSNASQVLPLASSPSTATPTNVPLDPQRFT